MVSRFAVVAVEEEHEGAMWSSAPINDTMLWQMTAVCLPFAICTRPGTFPHLSMKHSWGTQANCPLWKWKKGRRSNDCLSFHFRQPFLFLWSSGIQESRERSSFVTTTLHNSCIIVRCKWENWVLYCIRLQHLCVTTKRVEGAKLFCSCQTKLRGYPTNLK